MKWRDPIVTRVFLHSLDHSFLYQLMLKPVVLIVNVRIDLCIDVITPWQGWQLGGKSARPVQP